MESRRQPEVAAKDFVWRNPRCGECINKDVCADVGGELATNNEIPRAVGIATVEGTSNNTDS